MNHLLGYREDGTDVIGVYPLLADGTCRFLVFDFDNHEKDFTFILYGDNSGKENERIRRQLKEIPRSKSFILVATGQKIGKDLIAQGWIRLCWHLRFPLQDD